MLVTRMEKWVEQQRLELDQRVNEGVHQAKEQLKQQAEKAEQRGQQKGEATLLLRLLERRFGALPDLARVRVLAADTDTLEEWGLRVLEAATLDEVLA